MDPSSRTWASATPLPTAPDDVLARRLVLLSRAALLLAPRRRGVPPAGGLALAATEGVVDRVHRDAADRRALVLPAGATGFAEVDQLVFRVADHADRPLAGRRDEPHLSGGKTKRGIPRFLRHQLHAGA